MTAGFMPRFMLHDIITYPGSAVDVCWRQTSEIRNYTVKPNKAVTFTLYTFSVIQKELFPFDRTCL